MKTHYKSIFLSDIHLFSRHCKAEILSKFLKEHKSDNLFLIGDILDLEKIKYNRFYCDKHHIDIIQRILKLTKKGLTQIYYITGNHDYEVKHLLRYNFNLENIQILEEYEYQTHDKKIILLHGDGFDLPIIRSLYFIGDFAYSFMLDINHWFNKFRQLLGLPYWSLSKKLKHSVKDAIKYIEDYENSIYEYCEHKKYDGLISGHIHKNRLDFINGKYILNCGDFVETCSAILETYEGEFILVEYINNEFKEIKRIKIK